MAIELAEPQSALWMTRPNGYVLRMYCRVLYLSKDTGARTGVRRT